MTMSGMFCNTLIVLIILSSEIHDMLYNTFYSFKIPCIIVNSIQCLLAFDRVQGVAFLVPGPEWPLLLLPPPELPVNPLLEAA